jgi:hypothetical protein
MMTKKIKDYGISLQKERLSTSRENYITTYEEYRRSQNF